MERILVRDVEPAYRLTAPSPGSGGLPLGWGHGLSSTRVLAWSGDPAYPESTAQQLVELLPQADLFVARTRDDFQCWTDRALSFLRSLPS